MNPMQIQKIKIKCKIIFILNESADRKNYVTFSDIYFNKYDKYESFNLTG